MEGAPINLVPHGPFTGLMAHIPCWDYNPNGSKYLYSNIVPTKHPK